MTRLIPIVAVVGLACASPTTEAVGCTGDLRPAIVVEIRDASTGAAVADLARGVVRDGAYIDSLRPAEASSSAPSGLFSRQAAHERVGTYAVHVERIGYAAWDTSGVTVGRDACHVLTARVHARMVTAP